MLCFDKPSSREAEYEYGSNFTIKYEILDETKMFGGNLWLKEGENLVTDIYHFSTFIDETINLEKIINKKDQLCYKLTSLLKNKYVQSLSK